MKRKTAVCVKPEFAGCSLLDFVARRFTYRSREEWLRELEAGRFLLNEAGPAVPTAQLAAGDRLCYLMPELEEPWVERRFTVLYEDDDLLAVDKPAPLPCHPGGRFFRHTLWALLKEQYGLANPSLVNRLDRETSGIVLVAKNKKAARRCCRQFADHLVLKRYRVVVEGEFPQSPLQAEGWLDLDPFSAVRKKVRFYPRQGAEAVPVGAAACRTSFRRLHYENGISFLEALPLTGRCHQIRATLCGLGFPVVGDKIYGVDEQLFLRFQKDCLTASDHQRLRMNRQALHAESLSLIHPADGRPLSFFAPLPAAFRSLLAGGGVM